MSMEDEDGSENIEEHNFGEDNVTMLTIQCRQGPLRCYYEEVNTSVSSHTVLLFPRGEDKCVDYFNRTINGQYRDLLVAMGLNMIIVDYRRFPNSMSLDLVTTLQSDIHQIYNCLFCKRRRTPLRIDSKKLIVIGRGIAGSLAACEFANSYREVLGLILESPVSKLHTLIPEPSPGDYTHTLPFKFDQIEAAINFYYNQCDKIQKYHGSLLILHSKKDLRVNLHHAEELYTCAGSRLKGLVIFDEGSHLHTFRANFSEYAESLVEFLKSCNYELPSNFESLMLMLDDIRLYDEISTNTSLEDDQTVDTCTEIDIY